jgi:transketolase
MADFTQSENHAARFQAIGWNTITIDGGEQIAGG